MSNTQFYLALWVPFFTLLLVYIAATVQNRRAINDLRSENRRSVEDLRSENRKSMEDLRSENRRAVDDLRSEMKAGFEFLGGRLARIEKKLDVLDAEIRIEHDRRLAALEARALG